MTILDSLNARLAVKKTATVSSLEKLGHSIATTMVGTSTAVFKELEHDLVQKDWASWNAKEKAQGNDWTHKRVIHEYGPKVRGLGSPTESFNHYVGDDTGGMKKVTPTQFHASPLPDKTPESTQNDHVQHLASKINQFNKKVDYNSWSKAAPRSYGEKIGKLKTYGVIKAEDFELVSKGCPNANRGKVCPDCGQVHEQDMAQPNTQNGTTQNPNNTNQQTPNQDASFAGNGLNANPNNTPAPQIVNASSMVQSMAGALKHPVQVNHDASGVGVTHAAMLVHPEWNQGAIKDKVDAHLKAQNWKSGKGSSGATGSKTYESPEGHKIHVATIGKHLVVSAEDKKGTAPTPYTPPQKPVKKSGDPILDAFEEGIFKAISTIDGSFHGKSSTGTI